MSIRVTCRGCGTEVDSSECDRQVRCGACQVKASIAVELAEYRRLWAKRTRYLRAGASIAGCDRQLGRLAKRIAGKVHQRLLNARQAAEVLNEELSRARQRADTADGRILVPRQGQEVIGSGARA